ncbi:unnamed protein product [Dibothriocephalus latus]|uniref:Uncharacterized protein n=1 Tax=Dibothriocephalus latus TaxID=60516 RepID=A0A3P7NGU5_DIBLA|nr:unnamed protein product [Dibothriocephalus latus]
MVHIADHITSRTTRINVIIETRLNFIGCHAWRKPCWLHIAISNNCAKRPKICFSLSQLGDVRIYSLIYRSPAVHGGVLTGGNGQVWLTSITSYLHNSSFLPFEHTDSLGSDYSPPPCLEYFVWLNQQ